MRSPAMGHTVRVVIVALFVVCAGIALQACDDVRRNWSSCHAGTTCQVGQYCNAAHECVDRLDAGVVDGGPIDAPVTIDGARGVDGAVDGSSVDGGDDAPLVSGPDASLDAALDGTASWVDVGVDASVDTFVPDAPGSCAVNADCVDPKARFCADGHCVACLTTEDCQDTTPVCSAAHACVSCAAVDAGCPAATPACEIASGRCLECLSDGQCTRDGGKSFCRAGACVGCGAAGASACASRDPSQPACLAGGTCVECGSSSDCKTSGKPICDVATHTCKPCTSDIACADKPGPGVCLVQDGHCASDEETVYVGTDGGITCSDVAAGAGSPSTPFCSLQAAVGAAKAKGKPVVVATGIFTSGVTGVALTQPLTLVGKSARITPASYSDGFSITSGELYLRKVTIAGSASQQTGVGILAQVTAGASLFLHLDGVTITGNPGGGILLGGAAFDIRNTSVVGNGPGQTSGGAIFGGIRIDGTSSAGPSNLTMVTLQGNQAPGLSCASAIQGSGVLATDNAVVDIATSCAVTACTQAGPTCGAQ
jgi:hypothetical protein